MRLWSSAFRDGGDIPKRYTQDGADLSPPLAWDEAPPQTRSFALIVDDPDAPHGTWVHWVIVDLPPELRALPEGVERLATGRQGKNDWHEASWSGPAPPSGRHRYRFKLHALDRLLGLPAPTKVELEHAMKGHVLAAATLVGTYQRARAA
jgi:Raf kinase inhibitor-like YbhB/YbcL family protein